MKDILMMIFFLTFGVLTLNAFAEPIDSPPDKQSALSVHMDGSGVQASAATDGATQSPQSASKSPGSASFSLLVSSIYNFRGLNVFSETSQGDQNALFSPSFTRTVFHPGLWFKYAGFFQINGDNRAYLVESGVGAEQNIAAGFKYDFSSKLTALTSLTYRFYPFASPRITGVTWPSWLEPAVGIRWTPKRDIRLDLQLSYNIPIQERMRDQRYMYTLFSIAKAFQVHPRVALDLESAFGYKLYADPLIWQDTIFDITFCASLPFRISEQLKLVPATNAAWGYMTGTGFGDQYMIYFSLAIVAEF